MKNDRNFYVKVLTLYLLIFISFLVKSYTKPNVSLLVAAVKQSSILNMIPEIIDRTTPHQAK